jgi:hypothetical protein
MERVYCEYPDVGGPSGPSDITGQGKSGTTECLQNDGKLVRVTCSVTDLGIPSAQGAGLLLLLLGAIALRYAARLARRALP